MELPCSRYPFQTGADLRGGGGVGTTGCNSVCVSVACVSSNTDNDEAAISHDWENVTKQLILGLRLNEGLNLRI